MQRWGWEPLVWVSSTQGTASVGASENISSTLLVLKLVMEIFLGNELSAFPSSWHFNTRGGLKFCLGCVSLLRVSRATALDGQHKPDGQNAELQYLLWYRYHRGLS